MRNITDIDDKIIKRALERGIPIRQLTDEMIAAMHEDIDALGIERPTHEPRATEYVAADARADRARSRTRAWPTARRTAT